jgi:hypothetical protein
LILRPVTTFALLREVDMPARAPGPRAAALPAAAPPSAASAPAPDPTLRIDGVLGMVVVEFRGADGRVAASIPTERELAAYRRAAAGGGTARAGAGQPPEAGCASRRPAPSGPSPDRRPVTPPPSAAPSCRADATA